MALGQDTEIIYRGRIRAGRPGVETAAPVTVRRCREYDIAFLDADAPRVDYESGEYRETYDGSGEVDSFFRLHDDLARGYLRLLDGVRLRGRVVADFGCGAGSFLDLVAGIAARTIGVEPHDRFRDQLRERGHRSYGYGADLLETEGEGCVDVAVGFHVIEHVEDPRAFLREMCKCLRPGGVACVATPNLHDIMLRLGGEPYRKFFYRTAHRWYFSGRGLARLATEAGFEEVRIGYRQEYDLGNAFSWIREAKPCGNGTVPYLDPWLESAWTVSLEASGTANVVHMLATRKTHRNRGS
jgi:2-polyprenyl-3-methyl-5-hydroxy-6-metoxy-1,4-benzoquinol methylase